MSHEGNQIKVAFCPVPSPEVQEEILSASVSNTMDTGDSSKSPTKESGERSKFGPRPRFDIPNFDFQNEMDWLPFPVNTGEVELSKAQQQQFLGLV